MKTFTSNNKKITIKDIAKEAGVSTATVSRYINQDSFVEEEKALKIQSVIEKYNYKPSRLARGLKIQRTMQIMLIVPDIKNPYYAKMYDTVQSLASKEKYSVILYNTNEIAENEFKAINLVEELNCDGIIFCSVSDNKDIINAMKRLNKPIVCSSGFDMNSFDTVHGKPPGQGMYIATKYLIECGHKSIAYAGGNPNSILNTRRYSGYKRAMDEKCIKINKEFYYCNSFTLEGGYQAGEYFYQLKNRPTAIACANDMIAIGIMQHFSSHNINVPNDISIVGMDDIAMSEIVKPRLTTVLNDSSEFASKAIKLLFDRIINGYDGAPREEFCSRKLIKRESVSKLNN